MLELKEYDSHKEIAMKNEEIKHLRSEVERLIIERDLEKDQNREENK